MKLKCSGKSSSDVDVKMQLNVSIYSPINFTSLDIRRRKTCLRDPALGISDVFNLVAPVKQNELPC